MTNVVSYVSLYEKSIPQNRNRHDEQAELYLFNLILQVLNGSPLEYFLHLPLLPLFLTQFLDKSLFLLFYFSLLDGFTDLVGYFLVTVIDDLDEQISTLIYGCSMKHNHLQDVENHGLVVE